MVASQNQPLLHTAEEFWRNHNGQHRELIAGRVVHSPIPGGWHGIVVGEVALRLLAHAKLRGDYAAVSSGYILCRNPDTVRGPDVSYISRAHMPLKTIPEGFFPFAPSLAVEVEDISDCDGELQTRVTDYLASGVIEVWTVIPAKREAAVYRASEEAIRFEATDMIVSSLLPSLTFSVVELFQHIPDV